MASYKSEMRKARRRAVRELKKQHRKQRNDYESELRQAGFSLSERNEALREFDKQCREAVKQLKRQFRRMT